MSDEHTATTLDRAALGWPPGPWDGEPDAAHWTDDATGLPCRALRHPIMGHWCGYVGIGPEHPLYARPDASWAADVTVHGGITYAQMAAPDHPRPDGPPLWWIGFDCGHLHDASPHGYALAREEGGCMAIQPNEHYRTLAYVRGECASLAAQLAALADSAPLKSEKADDPHRL